MNGLENTASTKSGLTVGRQLSKLDWNQSLIHLMEHLKYDRSENWVQIRSTVQNSKNPKNFKYLQTMTLRQQFISSKVTFLDFNDSMFVCKSL